MRICMIKSYSELNYPNPIKKVTQVLLAHMIDKKVESKLSGLVLILSTFKWVNYLQEDWN